MQNSKLNSAEMAAVLLVVIGGLNWLLVGAFGFNLVTALFGEDSLLARGVFVLVGLAAIYVLTFGMKLQRER